MKTIRAVLALLLYAVPLAAAPTTLTVINVKQNNYAVQPGDLTVTFTACDAANGNSFPATGLDILLVQNSDGSSAHNFTVNSVPDNFGRTDSSLTNYSVAASATLALHFKYLNGWRQSNGTISLACDNSNIRFAVLHFS